MSKRAITCRRLSNSRRIATLLAKRIRISFVLKSQSYCTEFHASCQKYILLSMKHVIIFTDGACKGNPGPGGWGAIVATDEMVKELGAGVSLTTNNRMELQAAVEA